MSDFLNMPLQVANQVLEKMDLMDLQSARKVCKSLRAAIEKFDSHCDIITFTIHNDDIKMELDNNKVTYTNVDNRGTKVTCNGRETQIEDENYVEIALNDLKTALKNVSTFHICMSTSNRLPITQFIEFLKSKAEKNISVEKIILWHIPFDDVLTILPYFDAEKLENFELADFEQVVQFERITYLDQWKNAKSYRFWSSHFDTAQIDFLFHFREFAVVHKFSTQIAVKLRDDLMKRSTFQSCQIFFDKSNTDLIEVAKVFKPDYAGGDTYKLECSNQDNNFSIECGFGKDVAVFRFYVKRL